MQSIQEKIKTELIENRYYNDIKYNINSKSRCKFTADFTEYLSYILTGIAVILSFAAGFFDNIWLSFASGCFGTTSLALLKFSSYAMSESKERTNQVNIILKKLGIEEIPDISV